MMGLIELTAVLLAFVSLASGYGESPAKLEARATSTLNTSSPTTFRRRALHAIAILNDRLYIEGGETSPYNATDDTLTGVTNPLNTTLWIPLDSSWTNTTVTFTEIEQDEPLPINNLRLWADTGSSTLYRWGGDGPSGDTAVADDIDLWTIKVDDDGTGTWAIKTASNDDFFSDIYSGASGAGTVCEGLGLYLGGYGSSASDSRLSDTEFPARMPLPGLLTYNMTDRTWANQSTLPLNPLDGGTWTSGEALCIPGYGDNSLVFTLGGQTTPATSAARADSEFTDFSNITIYNPISNEWYWQAAGGDVPRGRTQLCAVGVKGNNTYDIYVYGGVDRSNDALSDISVLSIPGFQWFSLDVTSSARMRQTCAVVGQSQMLVLGGILSEWDWASADPWAQALGIFDLNTWEWSDKYDVDADEYTTPDTILDWYNDGGYSTVDWSGDEVKALFGTATAWPDTVSTSSASASASASSSSSSSTPVGPIVGGVVGGVAALALVGATYFFWRRKHSKKITDPYELATSSPKTELHSESTSPAVGVEEPVTLNPVELPGNGNHKPVELPG
ncbi:hypothetical protein G7Z17_g591 [Cylindrodendrum hubeiense]|uniref:Kelch repeat protein n=1 Tax=Cylindrodendrum hubeiense TaxID=595255 RepID=A0A9P5HGI7_9HYPO|nr:hypothetical protein G7Z17_g591 [Cylindrodendrum hubeiense]